VRIGGLEGRAHKRSFLERLPLAADRPLIRYSAALLVPLIATVARFPFGVDAGYPFLTVFPAVALAAFLFGARAGVAAAFASGLLTLYFFIPPYRSFDVAPGSALAMGFYVFTVWLFISLIHWMQTAYARLDQERQRSASLAANRELLFRELQHRVSNNLQVVAALIALQKRNIPDEAARSALDEASRRLGLIGRIHRQLYEPTGERIGMRPFLSQLAADVIDSAGATQVDLQLQVEEDIDLAPDAAIPVALIVSEAISNSIEHGFAGRDGGAIRVSMAKAAGGVVLEVADDGPGLPPDLDPEHAGSLGLRIAATLARQLGGRFELSNDRGALARLTLPAAAAA
jgi:two-component sensor histidine kinase